MDNNSAELLGIRISAVSGHLLRLSVGYNKLKIDGYKKWDDGTEKKYS